MWDVLTHANLEKIVDLYSLGQGQLSSSFIVDYLLTGRGWITNRGQAEYAVALEQLGVDQPFISDAFNYGLSVEQVQVYLKAREAGWSGRDFLTEFALAARGNDSYYLDLTLQRISHSNGIASDNHGKLYFRPTTTEHAQVLQAVLVQKGYLPLRAEQLAQRMVAIHSLDYRRVDSLLKAGIADDALLGRLVAAGIDGEDVIAGNSEHTRYETGNRGERIKVSSSGNLSQFSSRSVSQFYSGSTCVWTVMATSINWVINLMTWPASISSNAALACLPIQRLSKRWHPFTVRSCATTSVIPSSLARCWGPTATP